MCVCVCVPCRMSLPGWVKPPNFHSISCLCHLLYYSILLKARHDEIFQKLITLHNHLLIRVNGNYEITTQKPKRKFFLPHWDLKNGPLEPKAGVLSMSYVGLYAYCPLLHVWLFRQMFYTIEKHYRAA